MSDNQNKPLRWSASPFANPCSSETSRSAGLGVFSLLSLRSYYRFILLALLICCQAQSSASTLPAGFWETTISGPAGGWSAPVGMHFEDNGRLYVWEKAGRVWFQEDGASSWTLLMDIREEVGNW